MIALVACHFILATLLPLVSRRLGRRVFLLAGVPSAATVGWMLFHGPAILAGTPVFESVPWAPSIGFELQLRIDAFALLMIALVAGVGVLIFAYSRFYFHDGPELGRLAALLVAFAGAMLGLVVADNLLALFLFWELTSITSYLLIGFDDRSAAARASALRALLITAVGGLAMLAGFVLLAEQGGTYTLSELLARAPAGGTVEIALLLILLGAFTKSAQAPFHFWLPGAMAAPTPVSAYLHSATMVKAGVYLVARLAPVYAEVPFWRPLVITVGLVTMLIGGWRALAQRDLKLLLAHGTTSQLGLLVVLLGAGYEQATLAGATLLLAHGAFKATLFMVVGIVDHETGTRDLTRLSGWYRPLRTTFWVAAVAGASMAGLPPMAGFIAKEAAFEAFAHSADPLQWIVAGVLVAGSTVTFAYTARFVWGAFAPKPAEELQLDRVVTEASAPSWMFLGPAALLAAASLLLGAFPGLMSGLVIAAAQALDPRVPDYPLALWHGLNLALALSAAAIAGGVVMWRLRHPIRAIQRMFHWPIEGARAHDWLVAQLLHVADIVTGRLQTGSLPMYLMVILTTAIAGPGFFLLVPDGLWQDVLLVDRPMQLPVALLIFAATAAAVRSDRRMVAVVAVSIVGYGVAFLFVIQGAPDLALTQLLVETLLLVLFVLVLRHLPPTFASKGTAWQATRIALATAVGLFAGAVALVAASARTVPSISGEYLRRALPDGNGHNVVNVILVDFRAFDTFGEIVVLTVAALGVIGLVRAARRDRKRTVLHEEPYRPSTILNGAVRILFHTVLLASLVLLVIGHDRPGGGFIGGLVAGAAFVFVYLAGGAPRVRRAEPASPELYLGAGVTLAALTGAAAWIAGREFLEALVLTVDLPLSGSIKLSSVFLFDAGVYLVVVGLVTALLRAAGGEETVAS
jgi:multicomponent Na+:H+ antiporter subunit A